MFVKGFVKLISKIFGLVDILVMTMALEKSAGKILSNADTKSMNMLRQNKTIGLVGCIIIKQRLDQFASMLSYFCLEYISKNK